MQAITRLVPPRHLFNMQARYLGQVLDCDYLHFKSAVSAKTPFSVKPDIFFQTKLLFFLSWIYSFQLKFPESQQLPDLLILEKNSTFSKRRNLWQQEQLLSKVC